MADQRITELGALAGEDVAAGDQFVLVDVSDNTMAASGTDKRIAKSELDELWLPASAVSALGLDLIDSANAAAARAVIGTDAPGDLRAPIDHVADHGFGGGDALTTAILEALGVPMQRFKTGRYYTTPGSISTFAPAVNRLTAAQILIGEQQTFDRICVSVTIAGAAGALARLGIYEIDADGLPGALVLDAGTVAVDSTGFKEAVINQALDPGAYAVAAVLQVNGATLRAVSGSSTAAGPNPNYGMLDTAEADSPAVGLYVNGVNGALPDPFGVPVGLANAPRVFLRAA